MLRRGARRKRERGGTRAQAGKATASARAGTSAAPTADCKRTGKRAAPVSESERTNKARTKRLKP
jgi:hypothetical protein